MKDELFNKPITKQFEFDEDVASVFDDMLNRSIPHYDQMLELTTSFALKYTQENSTIYDLGCSTASTLINIANNSEHSLLSFIFFLFFMSSLIVLLLLSYFDNSFFFTSIFSFTD